MIKAERDHLSNVSDLGCIVCLNNGYAGTPAEIHHIANQGVRASTYETLPLCPFHHRNGNYGEAVHSGRRVWEEANGTERELLKQVIDMLQ